ncbi:Protein disulfide-isomerase A3 [Boothiomyces sp. JEL0866]|nr:Protein disulfide-isomerase A3 [Boothiomyces sp. JEL0866]
MTHEQKVKLRKESDEIDKHLDFLKFDEIAPKIKSTKTLLIFFGANWCHNTQKFNPKYLKVQEKVKEAGYKDHGFEMYKVECAIDREKFCIEEYQVDGFPTLLTFADGKLLEEYPSEDETETLLNYIKLLVKESSNGQAPIADHEIKSVVKANKDFDDDSHHDVHPPVKLEESVKEDTTAVTPTGSILPFLLVVGVVAVAAVAYVQRRNKHTYGSVSGKSYDE